MSVYQTSSKYIKNCGLQVEHKNTTRTNGHTSFNRFRKGFWAFWVVGFVYTRTNLICIYTTSGVGYNKLELKFYLHLWTYEQAETTDKIICKDFVVCFLEVISVHHQFIQCVISRSQTFFNFGLLIDHGMFMPNFKRLSSFSRTWHFHKKGDKVDPFW